MSKRVWLSADQLSKVRSAAEIVQRVCGLTRKDSLAVARDACVFNVPRKYVGGRTTARGYE